MPYTVKCLTLEHVKNGICLCGGLVREDVQPSWSDGSVFARRLRRFECFSCGRDLYVDPVTVAA